MQHLIKRIGYLMVAAIAIFGSCSKRTEMPVGGPDNGQHLAGFTRYVIAAGTHFATENTYQPLDVTNYRFQVYFDSTAIYNLPGDDQLDINKLSGFADNGGLHQQYSARIGWRWSDGRLRLFGFVHNNGIQAFGELGTIDIGKIYTCSISVEEGEYVFMLDDPKKTVRLKREAGTISSLGYRLYPYFGGNHAAPHEIRIWIKYL